MPIWEHRIEDLEFPRGRRSPDPNEESRLLTNRGREGWELCSVIRIKNIAGPRKGHYKFRYYFKRNYSDPRDCEEYEG